METEEKAKNKDDYAEEQVQARGWQDAPKVNSLASLERVVAHLKNSIWILAILTALIGALGIANMMIAKKAFEGVKKHLVLMGELSESLKEIQKTTAQLKKMVEDLSDTDEEGNQGDPAQIGDSKI
jgi:hypothetical protein